MKRWLTVLCFALASTAWAQPYPSRPIRVIVPFVPGGNVDITARTVAPALGDALGQPVVVENRPGAAGMVGAQAMISSPADGYTLMMGSNSSLAVAPNLYASWPYDPIKGIAPISNLAITPFVLVVRLGLPAQSLAEFVKLAKEKPGRLSMASGGNGSSNHLVGELFQMMTGLKLSHVPYKGTGAALVDLAGGQVDLLFDQASSTVPNVRGGKIRALAVASSSRQSALPDTPTFAEAGLRDFEIDNFTGLVGPAGMPLDAVARVHAAAVKALATPQVRERFASLGVQPVGDTPEQFGALIREDLARWSRVIKSAGVKVE
ncbi:MAG: tripartite tricarboxylate transporter substrate binding protein [Betaproteobacteria bacterium]|nr:MAG: tripartite tricarboxylate transporter substrate binding protein [Betaproteobacteria bacterium]TMI05895.1 MAG: tripartite tricarboxylate transporter substrate binding protein [Betaproteobacteria bacterium]